jgi:hypothetical protein
MLSSKDAQHSNFTFLAGLVGCGGLSASAELSCMKGVGATVLKGALSDYVNSKAKPSISFMPVADEKVVFANTTDRALKGLIAKVVSILLMSPI